MNGVHILGFPSLYDNLNQCPDAIIAENRNLYLENLGVFLLRESEV